MKRALFLMILGLLLAIVGAALMFVIVPSMKVFPDDVDVIRKYDLEYLTLLDAETMEFFDTEPGENPNLFIQRHVTVEDVEGQKALVREEQIVFDGDTDLVTVVYHYALDRKSLASIDDYPTAWAENEGFWDREGLVIGWGIDSEKKEYIGFADDYLATVELEYVAEEERGGITTYRFHSESEPRQIAPAYVEFLHLPTELTIDELRTLAANIEIEDEETKRIVENFLPLLIRQAVETTTDIPEGQAVTVPLIYYYDYVGDYWIEPQTGVLIDVRKREHRAVTFPPEIIEALKVAVEGLGQDPAGVDELLPLTVNDFVYVGSPESIQDARHDAEEAINQIRLFGLYIPIGLYAIGGLLFVLGIIAKRKSTTN